MMLTKKHFKAIAEILQKRKIEIDIERDFFKKCPEEILLRTIKDFCIYLKSENTLFSESKFTSAIFRSTMLND